MSYLISKDRMKAYAAKKLLINLTANIQKVYFIYGMRRSGNHACIRWLTNALEGRDIAYQDYEKPSGLSNRFAHTRVKISESGKTFFYNDLCARSGSQFLSDMWLTRKKLRNADNVIISAEDCHPKYLRWKILDNAQLICVRRSTLNLLASRYQRLNKQARKGISEPDKALNERFFSMLKELISEPEGHIWSFERWQQDCAWRRQFLHSLSLTEDVLPPLATEGQGSSFTGLSSQIDVGNLVNRAKMVEPQDAWKAFLANVAQDYPSIFETWEIELIRTL